MERVKGTFTATLTDSAGRRVRPGMGRHPDEAAEIKLHVPTAEVAIIDCIEATLGTLDAAANMLGLDKVGDRNRAKYPKQCDLDEIATNAATNLRLYAARATSKCARSKRHGQDKVLVAAIAMLRDYNRMVCQVNIATDPSPILWLASRWKFCAWALLNGRSNEIDRAAAVGNWKTATDEFGRLLAGLPLTGNV